MTQTQGNTALAKVEPRYQGLQMAVSPKEAQLRIRELQAFVKSVMVRNEDYGTIPGTQKPSLWQPGAQKLAELYGLAWSFEDVSTIENWDHGFFFYRKKCIVTSRRDGSPIGEGVGSCNSREDKYAWRWIWDNQVPSGTDVSGLKSKKTKNGVMYRFPNDDPYSNVNTIEKMAAKRAFIAGIISATRSAGLFTQDLEDLPSEAFGEAEPTRSWQQDATITYEEPAPVIAAIAAAADKKALNKIARDNKNKSWTDEDRDKIREALEARVAALSSEGKPAQKPAAAADPPATKQEPKTAPDPEPEPEDRQPGEEG